METHLTVKQPQVMTKPSLKPLYSPDEMISFHKDVTELITKALVDGQDYGSVPGIQKKFLFKPGAERLCKAFGCTAHYEVIASEVNYDIETKVKTKYGENNAKGRFSYTIRCSLKTADDRVIGDGIGLASTTEKKYSYAPCDNNNTVIKMAQKRALIASVLNAFGLSDRFSQDEDTVNNEESSEKTTNDRSDSTGKKAPARKVVFDAKNQAFLDKLEKVLVERKTPPDQHLAIADWLDGKEFSKENVESAIDHFKPVEIPF